MSYNHKLNVYVGIIITLGLIVFVGALLSLPYHHLDWWFVALSVFTIAFGSLFTIHMPYSKVVFLLGDALVYVIFLVYGGEAAVLTAGLEALSSSLQFKYQNEENKKLLNIETPFFNGATLAISTACTYATILLLQQYYPLRASTQNIFDFSALILLLAVVQFLANSLIAAVHSSLQSGTKLWRTWNDNFLVGFVSFIVGAVFAGVFYKIQESSNNLYYLIFVAALSLGFVTIRKILSDLKQSRLKVEKAEQLRLEEAQKHIAELNTNLVAQELISNQLQVSKLRLQYESFHDRLTGLPNRNQVLDRIQYQIDYGNSHKLFCVIIINFNSFTNINDLYGYSIGDKLLIAVGHQLQKMIGQNEALVARLGGDEFALLLFNSDHAIEINQLINQIESQFKNPFIIDEHKVAINVSIGVVVFNKDYSDPNDVLRDADIAMRHARSDNLGWTLFGEELRIKRQKAIETESDLRYAVAREELCLFLQPIVSLETGQMVGCEALMRWQHPRRGLVSPADFIPIAESSGQIVGMTNWILREACIQLTRWRLMSPAHQELTVSVNLSGKHFSHGDVVRQVKETLGETRLPAKNLKLEITESAVMKNAEEAIKVLHSLRELGVELLIDDFGTGYSSLSYLHQFPINTLKIDRSFVSRLGVTEDGFEIVRTIINLSENLQLGVIAEGVETIDQANKLLALGCSQAQGYLFAVPMSQHELHQMLSWRSNWLPAGTSSATNSRQTNILGKTTRTRDLSTVENQIPNNQIEKKIYQDQDEKLLIELENDEFLQ